VTIAFATYVSIGPKRSTACSTTCATSSWTVQSAGTASASEPNASISRTHASSPSAPRAVTTTFAPRLPAARATARPRPLDAPVTTRTCSPSGFFTTFESPLECRWKPGTLRAMPNIGTGEIILLLLLALLLFGAKRLPEIGRSLGTGMKEFKDSVTGNKRDDQDQPELPASTSTETTSSPREHETV
jgi:sec-independent protein translocase protein TatA